MSGHLVVRGWRHNLPNLNSKGRHNWGMCREIESVWTFSDKERGWVMSGTQIEIPFRKRRRTWGWLKSERSDEGRRNQKKNERQLFILYVAYTSPVGKEQPCAIGFYNQIWTAIIYFFPFHKKCFLSHRKVFLSSLKPSEILQKKHGQFAQVLSWIPSFLWKMLHLPFCLLWVCCFPFRALISPPPPLSGPTSCVLQGTAEDDRTRERFIFGKQIKTKRVTWYSGRSLLTWEGEAVPATSTPRLCRPAQNLDGRRSVNTRLHAKRHLPFTWVTFWLTSPTFIFFLIAFDHRWLFHSRL